MTTKLNDQMSEITGESPPTIAEGLTREIAQMTSLEEDAELRAQVTNGDLIPKAKLQELIDAAIKKEMEKQIANPFKKNDAQIQAYLDRAGLTNKDFALKLMNLHVQAKYASVLRDEHMAWEKEQIWSFIRAKYKED